MTFVSDITKLGVVSSAHQDDLRNVISQTVIDTCLRMAELKIGFAVHPDDFCSADYFVKRAQSVFEAKPGVQASDAVMDIFLHSSDYSFDCAIGVEVVFLKTILDLIGCEKFNRAFPKLSLSSTFQTEEIWRRLLEGDAQPNNADDRFFSSLRPGTLTYVINHDVTSEAKKRGHQGDNVIVMPHMKLYSHPRGLTSLEEILEEHQLYKRSGGRRSSLVCIAKTLSVQTLSLYGLSC